MTALILSVAMFGGGCRTVRTVRIQQPFVAQPVAVAAIPVSTFFVFTAGDTHRSEVRIRKLEGLVEQLTALQKQNTQIIQAFGGVEAKIQARGKELIAAQAIITKSCSRCHNAKRADGGFDLSDLSKLSGLQKAQVEADLATEVMPKDGAKLTAEEYGKIRTYIYLKPDEIRAALREK